MSYIRKGKIKDFRSLIAVMGLTPECDVNKYMGLQQKFYKVLCRSVGVT